MIRIDYQGRVIKSILLNPDLLYLALSSLDGRYFEGEYNAVWRVFVEVAKVNDRIDYVGLVDALTEAGIDAEPYVNSSAGGAYHEETLPEAINELKRRWQLKELHKKHEQWTDETNKVSTDVELHIAHILDDINKLQSDAYQDNSASTLIERARSRSDERIAEGVPLGFGNFDFVTQGMKRKQLWVVGGYTSVGKSWIGVQAVRQHVLNEIPTLWLSLEMSSDMLLARLAANIINTMNKTIKVDEALGFHHPTLEGQRSIDNAYDLLAKSKLYIEDGLTNWQELRAKILYYIHAKGVKCVVIDYVQNIIVPSAKSEYETMNAVSRDIQRIAVKYDVFALMFSQVNRESVRTNEQKVFGFRGSSSLENAADVALILRKENLETENEKIRYLEMGKNRNGILTKPIKLEVDFAYASMKELSDE